MKCSEAEFLISMRVDGEPVGDARARGLEEHLGCCAACRSLAAVETARAEALERALGPGGRGTAALAARILEAARAPSARAAPAGRVLRFPHHLRAAAFGALAAAAAAAVAVAVSFSPRPPEGAPAVPGDGATTFPHFVSEETSTRTELIDNELGDPWARDVRRSRWSISPLHQDAKGQRSAEVLLDVERVDTRYFRLASLTYH